jgi:hypothetical protein
MNNWRFGPLSSSRMHMEVLGVPIDLPERRRMFETELFLFEPLPNQLSSIAPVEKHGAIAEHTVSIHSILPSYQNK